MEHVTRSTGLMDRMEDQPIGPDTLTMGGDLGGKGIFVSSQEAKRSLAIDRYQRLSIMRRNAATNLTESESRGRLGEESNS